MGVRELLLPAILRLLLLFPSREKAMCGIGTLMEMHIGGGCGCSTGGRSTGEVMIGGNGGGRFIGGGLQVLLLLLDIAPNSNMLSRQLWVGGCL